MFRNNWNTYEFELQLWLASSASVSERMKFNIIFSNKDKKNREPLKLNSHRYFPPLQPKKCITTKYNNKMKSSDDIHLNYETMMFFFWIIKIILYNFQNLILEDSVFWKLRFWNSTFWDSVFYNSTLQSLITERYIIFLNSLIPFNSH